MNYCMIFWKSEIRRLYNVIMSGLSNLFLKKINDALFHICFFPKTKIRESSLLFDQPPLITVTGWKKPGRHRRALGLYAFFYFALHFITFAVVDYGLDFREILRLTTEKSFIIVGSVAGLLLLLLAATSFKFWMKYLGKNWKRLHQSVYLIGVLVVIHYAWAVKGSISTLSGDIGRPLLMGSIVFLLLLLRVPPIRRWIVKRKKKR